MSSNNKKFYITTSIAYTNAPPHIGFALELVQADVLARYHRLLGDDVFFLTGTDEHGFKIAEAAEKAGKKPEVFVNEISAQFEKLTNILNISNNDFIKTTEKRHFPVVKEVWNKLKEKEDLYLKNYEGWYCKGCEAFIIERTSHEAGPARCLVHGQQCELVKERNWFFKLSKPEYQAEIRKKIENVELKILPEARKNEVLGILNQKWTDFSDNLKEKRGLTDISFSRAAAKLTWGIPVPDDPSQTIYVWADALTNYISALGYPDGEKFKRYWPADVQCIGKDILKFHTLIWPAMLLSLGLELPKTIFVHGFITADGQKMSKSLGNVVDPFELVEKYGADAVRYFLLREIPSTEDGDFTIEKFIERCNADLKNGIGNLLYRTLTMAENYWGGIIPKIIPNDAETLSLGKISGSYVYNYQDELNKKFNKSFKDIVNFSFNNSLFESITAVFICQSYIEQHKLYKSSEFIGKEETRDVILYNTLEGIRHIAWMLLPFLPNTANKIFEQLGLNLKEEKNKSLEETIRWGELKPGTKIKKGSHLFEKFI